MILDSVEIKFFLSIINGMKDNKLSSIPIHIPIHEEEDRVIKVPIIKVKKNNNLEIKFIIKKKRIKNLYKWGMSPLA